MSSLAGSIGITSAIAVPIVRIALLVAGFSLTSFAWAVVAQGLVQCLAAATALFLAMPRGDGGRYVSLGEMRYLFSMSLFSSLTRITGTVTNNMYAVLITRHLGPSAAVAFEVTRQPIEIVRIFLDKPASALLPSFAHVVGARESDKLREYTRRYLQSLFWVLGLAVAGLSTLNEAFVTCWVGRHLYAGHAVNTWLVAGLVGVAIGNSSRLLLYGFGRIVYSSVAATIETLAHLGIALTGIRLAGVTGLAATNVLSTTFVGFWMSPRVVISEYLTATDRRSLLWQDLIPSVGACAGTIGILIGLRVISRADDGWGVFAMCVGMTIVVYTVFLVLMSRSARAVVLGCTLHAVKAIRRTGIREG